MAKHVSSQDIENIVAVLDYWPIDEKLSWNRLCMAIEEQLELVPAPTRQTLQKYARIKNAFDLCKKSPAAKLKILQNNNKLPASLRIAQLRIEAMEARVNRLEKENSLLLEQFIIWQYNAYKYGVSIAKLNEPLPKKN